MAIRDVIIGNVKGQKGDAGTITSVTASVANNVGTPSCNVTLGGTPSDRTINLAFSGLKGAKGDTGSVTTGGTTGDFHVVGDLSTDGFMSVGDGASILGDTQLETVYLNTDNIYVTAGSMSNLHSFTTYYVGGIVSGNFTENNVNTTLYTSTYSFLKNSIINHHACPRLLLTCSQFSSRFPASNLVMDVLTITSNSIVFGGEYPIITDGNLNMRKCYVVVKDGDATGDARYYSYDS